MVHSNTIISFFTDISDPTANFIISDMDVNSTDATYPKYYGFRNSKSNWYIMREDKTGNVVSYRYCKGTDLLSQDTNYDNSWTNRATLNYTTANQAI